jgi:hypothetical protein
VKFATCTESMASDTLTLSSTNASVVQIKVLKYKSLYSFRY